MKRLALIAVAVALVVGAGVLSVRHYNRYQVQQNKAKQIIVDQQAKALADAQAARVDLVAKYENQRLNCEQGLAAYNLLSTLLKGKTPQPVCGPVITK